MKTTVLTPLLGSIMLAALSGCAAYPNTERDFGNSVRHMVQAQRVNNGPVDTTPVDQGDGERLNNVLEAYRGDVSRPQDSAQPFVIDLGEAIPR